MNLLRSLAVISSPNERKMPDALSPSQIHILFGDGEAEKKPIRTRWQIFLPQMREKCPIPCPHPRSTFYSGLERPRRSQLELNSCMKSLVPWYQLKSNPLYSPEDCHQLTIQYQVKFSERIKVKNSFRHHNDSRCTMAEQLLLLLTRTYLPKLSINVRVLKLKTPGPHEPWLFLY